MNNVSLIKASGILAIVAVIYSVVHEIYDIITKTDIEKCLTYRGRDRILSSFFMFVIYLAATIISAYQELADMNEDLGVLFSSIMVVAVSLVATLLTLLILSLIQWFFVWKKIYPTYEIKIKDKYWRILKVTKDGNVILKREDLYLTLSSVKDLNDKTIRVQGKEKK